MICSFASEIEAACGKSQHPVGMTFMAGMRRAGRMSISPEVIERIEEMKCRWDYRSADNYAADILATVRLPFDPLWLEWDVPLDHQADAEMRKIGFLITREGPSLRLSIAVMLKAGPAINDVDALLTPDGLFMDIPVDAEEPSKMMWGFMMAVVDMAANLIMLLTARNSPVAVGMGDDFERVNKKRRIMRRPPLLSTKPVTWDLTRVERRAGRALDSGERAEAAAHLCRGHIKLRKSGAFWWSPHFRNTKGELPPASGRDHAVADTIGRMA